MRYQRRMRRRNFVPATECLEYRTLLNADIGVNLGTNSQTYSDPIWTDLHNLAYPWEAPSTTSGFAAADTAIPLTADTYPLANAATTFNLANYPDGNYQFSFTGTATVTFSDIGQLAGPVTVSNGVTSGTVVVNHNTGDGQFVDMQVSGLNAANPMDNFHLMMPGYGNGTTPAPMFTPAFLQSLQPFSNIRFLGWDEVNNSTLSNWADRVSPTNFITDNTATAVPYEDMIELCNEAHKDLWINIPALATPQFIQSLAQLVQTKLDPDLNVYVEYSNETWNTSFRQFFQILSAATLNPMVTQTTNTTIMVEQQTAYEEVSIAQIFKQTFGAESSRVRPILSGQATQSVIINTALQFIQKNFGPPSQFIYATAEAAYVGLPNGDNVAGLTLDQVFTDMNQYLTSKLAPALQSDAAAAAKYELPMVAYEGGQGLLPGTNALNYNVLLAAQSDPRMYQLYIALMTDWQEAGGGVFDAFTLDGPPANSGFWGMLPNVLSPGGQGYDALISLIDPLGDANLDGIVDYSDFQSLEANYGATGAYWKQGDFNDDGTVNWQDLNLLKQNLDPAGFTLSQFAQAALFGQLGTVVPGQSLEYDGYGVTYASSLPFAASSGTVTLNENSQGTAIILGGASYSEGLGVASNSSISLALNGQYSRFESTIGVDGSSNTGSSVIYDVYGDGQLLYQSPKLTYASGAIPIDVNVAGVTTLRLVVLPAPGTTASTDHAVWADARLVSTANFGSTQPYAMTWQLAQNGKIVSTQTTDSFVFGAISGTYTLTLTVTDAQGDTVTASTSVVVTPGSASASHFMTDSPTEGNWIGTYGSQGYDMPQGWSSLPNYATVSILGAIAQAGPPVRPTPGHLGLILVPTAPLTTGILPTGSQ